MPLKLRGGLAQGQGRLFRVTWVARLLRKSFQIFFEDWYPDHDHNTSFFFAGAISTDWRLVFFCH